MLIDGEALINDGAAIVLFTIFSQYDKYNGFFGFMYFCLVVFLSPVFGWDTLLFVYKHALFLNEPQIA